MVAKDRKVLRLCKGKGTYFRIPRCLLGKMGDMIGYPDRGVRGREVRTEVREAK
jgi:hypothetical protein